MSSSIFSTAVTLGTTLPFLCGVPPAVGCAPSTDRACGAMITSSPSLKAEVSEQITRKHRAFKLPSLADQAVVAILISLPASVLLLEGVFRMEGNDTHSDCYASKFASSSRWQECKALSQQNKETARAGAKVLERMQGGIRVDEK